MATWNSRGLRGSTLEDILNHTIKRYEEQGLALIQKVPTPITPITIDKEKRHITLAYFEKISSVDYIGVVQGIPVCFDAKECTSRTFPLANVHEHQMEFMRKYEAQQGLAFLILYYTKENSIYYMRFSEIDRYWTRMKEGGRKSFTYEELDARFLFSFTGNHIPVLNYIQRDLDERESFSH